MRRILVSVALILSFIPTLGHSEVIDIASNAGPWSTALNPTLPYALGGVEAPGSPAVAQVTAGTTVLIRSATGLAKAGQTGGGWETRPPTGPDGHLALGVINGTTAGGAYFPSRYMPADYPVYLITLVGAFADPAGQVIGTPFKIGTASLTKRVPDGATQLLLGVNDVKFDDNSGAFAVEVTVTTNDPSPGSATGILARSGKFKPTTTFSDTYAEKLVTIPPPPPLPGDPREPATHEVIAGPERMSAKIVANLEGFDFPTEIQEDMAVALNVGGFAFAATLGEEESRGSDREGNPKPFDPAKAKATFFYGVDVLDREGIPKVDRDGNPIQRKVGTLVFAWSVKAGTLTVTLNNTDAGESGAAGIAASNFIGLADDGLSGGKVSFVGEPVPVSVTFGSATGQRIAYAKGITKTSYRQFGSEAAGTLDGPFAVNAVTVLGAADLKAPVLTANVPATDADADGVIDIVGTVTDLPPATFSDGFAVPTVDVFVNGSPAAELIDPTGAPDAKGKYLFTFTSVPLTQPSNTVKIVATDGDGNSTSITKTVTSTAF